jgi:HEPN domain-containing protein
LYGVGAPVELIVNLDRARAGKIQKTILYEDLCFDCQQAVEKSLKALLVAHDVESPHTHIVAQLLETLEKNRIPVPNDMKSSVDLTEYAVHTRYPGLYEPVTEEEYREALAVAECVYAWVNKQLK